MKIAFVDLVRQNKKYQSRFLRAVTSVIGAADFIQGKELAAFENHFAKFTGKKYCIGLNSGTDALFFALLAYGIGKGDEVITTANTYFSTAAVIELTGASAILVDINPKTYTMDPQQVAQKIGKKTRAIIPVHLYGQAAEMDLLMKLVKQHNLKIIEDCCQAHGAIYKGKTVPVGETGAFSFYPGKNLGCFGDGGALVTDNKKIFEEVMLLRNDGSRIKYRHELFGYKSRLDTIQAAVLNAKLPLLDQWNHKRRTHAKLYRKLLQGISEISLPQEAAYGQHVYHLFVIETDKRDELQAYLQKKGVSTVIHYPIPIHLNKPYRERGLGEGDFPITEEKSKRILSLPMFPELKKEEIEFVATTIKKFFK